jgi:hypothetical protein
MANNTTHGLKQYKILLSIIIFHKKMQREKQLVMRDPFLFI